MFVKVAGDLREVVAGAEAFVAGFDPDLYEGADAAVLVGLFTQLERVAAAGRTLAAGRVERAGAWRASGHRDARGWLAATAGISVGDAAGLLATAGRLRDLDATERRFRAGRLSEAQAVAVASAAAADPAQEHRLLERSERDDLRSLEKECRAVRVAAQADRAVAEREAVHATRYLRTWTGADGAFEGRFRMTAEGGAVVAAALDAHHEQVFRQARLGGTRDPYAALEADALVAAARASLQPRTGNDTDMSGPVPVPFVVMRVDHAAYQRGWARPGETSEIDSVGPVPVATIRRHASDAVIAALLHDGPQVIDTVTVGRTISRRARIALIERDRACVVAGCGATRHLEIHHLDPIANGGPTTLSNMARICAWHHDQITYKGATLTGPHPHWTYTPPPHPPPQRQ